MGHPCDTCDTWDTLGKTNAGTIGEPSDWCKCCNVASVSSTLSLQQRGSSPAVSVSIPLANPQNVSNVAMLQLFQVFLFATMKPLVSSIQLQRDPIRSKEISPERLLIVCFIASATFPEKILRVSLAFVLCVLWFDQAGRRAR